MDSKEITSLHHPLVKELAKLRSDKEMRKRTKTLLLMGKKTIRDLAETIEMEVLLESGNEPLDIKAKKRYLVSLPILKKITGLENPDGYAAVAPFPKEVPLQNQKSLLVFNGLSDPGNSGTLFRTALGLGWEGVIISPGSVDPFNDKALRSAKGASLKLPFCERTEEEILTFAKEKKMHLYTGNIHGKSLSDVSFHFPLLLILGNESFGPSPAFLKSATQVSIPMTKAIDSYNVAIAGSILMYHIQAKNL